MKPLSQCLFSAAGELPYGQKYYHISYTFEIPKEYKVLEVLLEYEPEKRTNPPKDLEKEVREAARTEIFREDPQTISDLINLCPLKNLINLAIKGPDGWRGEDHKFLCRREICLAEEGSTPCFSNGKNLPGQYELVLHVYAVFTDSLRYRVEVRGL